MQGNKDFRCPAPFPVAPTLVAENAAIFVGDVASEKLVKTKMAKSTRDTGWSILKTMLDYKCNQAGVIFM